MDTRYLIILVCTYFVFVLYLKVYSSLFLFNLTLLYFSFLLFKLKIVVNVFGAQ